MIPVHPRIVADVARTMLLSSVSHRVVCRWNDWELGKLQACSSITQDIEIIGWKNEANFLIGDYAYRHGFRI